ncbi:MAG: DEAD/DEAH box helicase [Parachlamydiales bacterium]
MEIHILDALEGMGFQHPSPIQQRAIPLIFEGRDLMAMAETGSGKTATCAIPICQRIDPAKREIQGLVVVPTRELAKQYATEAQKIGRLKGVKVLAVFGGEDIRRQRSKLDRGIHLLVATPGRLIDLIRSRALSLDGVQTLVLDEADEMLNMGFYEDLEFIIGQLEHEHQTLLFSATMPPQIKKTGAVHMRDPVEITLSDGGRGPQALEHHFAFCAESKGRMKVMEGIMAEMKPHQSLIFCRSRREAEQVCRDLRKGAQGVEYLHGGLSQSVRTRITEKFEKGKIHTLVATDVAARGLDFSQVSHVFLFHLPSDVDLYMHRAGRAGRSGRAGVAVTLVTHQELSMVPKVLKRLDRLAQWIGEAPQIKVKRAPAAKPPRKGRSKGWERRRVGPSTPKQRSTSSPSHDSADKPRSAVKKGPRWKAGSSQRKGAGQWQPQRRKPSRKRSPV